MEIEREQTIRGIKFVMTSIGCPEQYDCYIGDEMVAYVRLRWGHLKVVYPNVFGNIIFEHQFDDTWQGVFDDGEREIWLPKIVDAIKYVKDTESAMN